MTVRGRHTEPGRAEQRALLLWGRGPQRGRRGPAGRSHSSLLAPSIRAPQKARPIHTLATFLFLLLLTGCSVNTPDPHRDAWQSWRDARLDDLRQPDSWLSLAGLYWLADGEHAFGSDPGNPVVFPDNAPGRIGTFRVQDSTVTMTVEPGVTVTQDGEPVSEILLVDDHDGDPTLVELGSLSWHAILRSRGVGIRLRDSQSEVLTHFDGIDTYDYDPSWRVEGRFERYDPPRTLPVPSITGVAEEETAPGAAVFVIDGTEHRLDVTGQPADSSFFLVFGDKTNGPDTYGGGRFLWIDAPDPDGTLVLDFNRAYNPPCVFTPYATCPLPTPENRLPIRIEAGEKKIAGH